MLTAHLPNWIARLAALAALALLFGLVAPAQAQDPRPSLAHYRLEGGLALGGFDPVAYFTEFGGAPQAGSKDLTQTHRGVTYRFANEANRTAFIAQPERFEPAFGGWCAFGMSEGQRVEPQPKNFRLQDGRLLVFSKGGVLADPRSSWEKSDPKLRLERANTEWQKLSGELPALVAEADRDRPDLGQMNLGDGNLALKGWDPVSYFPEFGGRPQKGAANLAVRYRGVVYRFASAENKTAFLAAPQSFEPSYGGWCTYAMADGEKVEIDPQSFLIQAGRLLVFYDGLLGDTRKKWQKGDVNEQATRADQRWAAIITPGD